MHTELSEPSALVKVKDLGDGDYFWYNEELYFVCSSPTEIHNMLHAANEVRILVACLHDESLSLIGTDIEVLPETRNLTIVMDKVKQG